MIDLSDRQFLWQVSTRDSGSGRTRDDDTEGQSTLAHVRRGEVP